MLDDLSRDVPAVAAGLADEPDQGPVGDDAVDVLPQGAGQTKIQQFLSRLVGQQEFVKSVGHDDGIGVAPAFERN